VIALVWLAACVVPAAQPWSTPSEPVTGAFGAVVAVDPVHPTTEDALHLWVLVEPHAVGDPLVVGTRWFRDGAEVPELAGRYDVPSTETAAGELWSGELVVEAGDAVRVAAAAVEVLDTPPTVELSVSPARPLAGDALVAAVSVADPDGAPEVSITWYLDGFDAGVAGPEVPGDRTARDQAWLARARVDSPFGPVDAWAGVVVGNTPPAGGAAVVSPSDPDVLTGATCVPYGLEDPDGDAVQAVYAWTVDGAVVDGVAGEFLEGGHFRRDQRVGCELWPFDGARHGDVVVSPEVVVANAPPGVIQEAKLFPQPFRASGPIVLIVDRPGSDPDGDALTQDCEFYVDGVYHSTGTQVSGPLQVGQVWTCEARNFDGLEYGEPLVLEGTVQ
jgi:hypothetical protein